jgi:hypothetical protein
MIPARLLVVPGNWASVKGGKWHLISTDVTADNFREPVTSRCRIRFVPLNATGGEAPPTNDYWICAKCAKAGL